MLRKKETMKQFILILALSWLVLPTYAQETLSLENAIAIGLKNNYQIQIAQKRIEIAKNNNSLAAAGAYPSITGSLSSGNSFLINNSPASLLSGKTLGTTGLTPSVDLSWTLFDNYKVKISKQRLEDLEAQSVGNSDLVIENAIHSIILGYYRAVIEGQKIKVFEEVFQLSKDRYHYEVENQKIGTGSTFNVVQMRDAYWTDSTNLLRQKTAYSAAIRNLNTAMGEENWSKEYVLTDSLSFEPQPFAYEVLQKEMLSNSRSLRNQFLNQKILQTNTELQAASEKWYIPKVTLSSGLNQALSYNNDFTPTIGFGDFSGGGSQFNYYLNFTASFNLFDAGAAKRAVQNAVMEEMVGDLNIADQQRTLSSQLANQLALYQDQIQFVRLNEELIVNAAQNLDISAERYKRSLINSFDYRNVQLAYLRASLTKLESIYNLKTIETELTRLTGGIIK